MSRLPRRRTSLRRVAAAPPSLVVLGDLMLDIVVRASGGFQVGSDVPGTIRFRVGGSAANVARAFARGGGRATLITGVGRDGWGTRLVEAVRADGVTVRAVRTAGATGRLLAMVGSDGERTFVTERGAADGITAADLRDAWFRDAGALHVPAYGLMADGPYGAARGAAELLRTKEVGRRVVVSVDLASYGPLRELGLTEARRRIGALAPDLVFANQREASVVAGRRVGSGGLLDLAPVVIVKEGAGGCRVLWRDGDGLGRLDVATAPLVATDTTGAGDAFAAGFLRTLMGVDAPATPAILRRAALAGHRSAADLLRRPRPTLAV